MNPTKNPNCEHELCTEPEGEVRLLPYSADGNMILCLTCYRNEMWFRRAQNRDLEPHARYELPSWQSLKVYEPKEGA